MDALALLWTPVSTKALCTSDLQPRRPDPQRCLGPALPAQILSPNKRVYPQYTDGDLARIMRDLDFPLPFTTWSEPKREGPYYGKTHLEGAAEPEG
jgi:hypothetical protein